MVNTDTAARTDEPPHVNIGIDIVGCWPESVKFAVHRLCQSPSEPLTVPVIARRRPRIRKRLSPAAPDVHADRCQGDDGDRLQAAGPFPHREHPGHKNDRHPDVTPRDQRICIPDA